MKRVAKPFCPVPAKSGQSPFSLGIRDGVPIMSGQLVQCSGLLWVRPPVGPYGLRRWWERGPGTGHGGWDGSFWVESTGPDGVERWGPLSILWPTRFESVRPNRSFPAYRGQRNWTGWYWSVTCAGHIGYESWLERDHAMLLDFDPDVMGVASQPFMLSWSGRTGCVCSTLRTTSYAGQMARGWSWTSVRITGSGPRTW